MTEQQATYKTPPPPPNFDNGWVEANGCRPDEDTALLELWDLFGTIPEFRDEVKDLPVHFFIHNRQEEINIPFTRAIKDHADHENVVYAELYLKESFTTEQKDAFIAWMQGHHPDTEIKPKRIDYPIANNITGAGAIPVGGPQDFYMLSKADYYDLPFDVWFYYDLRNAF